VGSIVGPADSPLVVSGSAAQPGYRLAGAEALLVTAMMQTAFAEPTASAVKSNLVAFDGARVRPLHGSREQLRMVGTPARQLLLSARH
jgi:hypothetical protein